MSDVTRASVDYALTATRAKWLIALKAGEFEQAKKIQARLDELLDQLCATTK